MMVLLMMLFNDVVVVMCDRVSGLAGWGGSCWHGWEMDGVIMVE